MSEVTLIREALQSPETSATFLNALIRRQYGDEAYDWDPLTVYLELQADYGVDMSSEAMEKWSALQVALTTNAFYNRLDAFLAICNTLSDGAPYFTAFDPVTVEEAAWGIAEVALNRNPLPFSYAIKQYLYVILEQDGYSEENYPEPIKLALGLNPKRGDIINATAGLENKDTVELYVDEGLQDIVKEFDKIPSMSSIDDFLFKDATIHV